MAVQHKILNTGVDAGKNIVVQVLIYDDADPAESITESTWAVDLTPSYIADWAVKRWAVYLAGKSSLASVDAIKDVVKAAAPLVDPALVTALQAAEADLAAGAELAHYEAIGLGTEYQAVLDARAAIKTALAGK